jgi:thioredoxin reductase
MIDVAIVGAGPYGLSLAAHLRAQGVEFRIFGQPMDSWSEHMPKGMLLKSDGFASNLSDPARKLTLKGFCVESGEPYGDDGIPVTLERFVSYGLEFARRMVPMLERQHVVAIDRAREGFALQLESGEMLTARRVVLAVGITHFAHVPRILADLPPELASHSFAHHDLSSFRGRRVIVIGGGASAIDIGGLLRDVDADVGLVARRTALKFSSFAPPGGKRRLWQRIRHPQSGLGPGLRSRLFCEAPLLFRCLPAGLRRYIVNHHLGPAGGPWSKQKLIDRVPLFLGRDIRTAAIKDNKVELHLVDLQGAEQTISADHVIAATGYRPRIDRLCFLSADIRSSLATMEGAPLLSMQAETSIPGLYFIGLASAYSFGPLMRFAFGADYMARRLSRVLHASLPHAARRAQTA